MRPSGNDFPSAPVRRLSLIASSSSVRPSARCPWQRSRQSPGSPRSCADESRLPEARQRARAWSSTRMAGSRSPWARYRSPRQPWAMTGVDPRPAGAARRSAAWPWRRLRRRPRARSRSAPETPGTGSLYVCPGRACCALSAASTFCRSSSAARAKSPRTWYAPPRKWDASTCKARSPSAAARSSACRPAANGAVGPPVVLSTRAILASTRPSRVRSSSAPPGLRPRPTGRGAADALPVRQRVAHSKAQSRASTLVLPSSGRCARAWRACSKAADRLAVRCASRPWSRPAGSRPPPCPTLPPAGHGAPAGRPARPPAPRRVPPGPRQCGRVTPGAAPEQTAVSHVVCEGVLEGVLVLGKQPGLVEELCRLHVGQVAVQVRRAARQWPGGRARASRCQSPRWSGAGVSPLLATGRCAPPARPGPSRAPASSRAWPGDRPGLPPRMPVSTRVRTLSSR